MSNIYNFSSDKIDIFALNIDRSGSMEDDEKNVIKGMKMFQESFENFPEANSIAVSVSTFADSFYPGEFKRIEDLKFDYSAIGATALHYSIVKGAKHLQKYMREVTEITGCIPRATYIVFSDGQPMHDSMTWEDSEAIIKELNLAGVTTVFVAFGNAINSDFGRRLGFSSTLDVNNRETLTNFLGVELSKSCKEQSQSLKALGANFFSQAINGEKSEGYSHTTAQALDDESFFNDLADL